MVIDAPLTLALGKGRLLDQSLAVFERLGYDMNPVRQAHRERKMIGLDADGHLRALLAKDPDVPVYVEHGTADIGIAGREVLRERGSDVLVPLLLGALLPDSCCRLVLAAPRALTRRNLRRFHDLRIATKYPNIARDYASRQGLSAEILGLSGQIELAPASGLADVIVDIVQTGTTLRENDLVELDTIFSVEACLIVNRAAQKLRPTEIKALVTSMEDLIEGIASK
ncbi:MAG: ATP phosphoribosyltransferase [Ardenticatenaceae bacterium]|nr:ATP phosphoribosyltransferase [Ardenticatenaceae bacterium]HBY95274.1 ATP phosphoribosyltransferase [Chloroflexota bacterium]